MSADKIERFREVLTMRISPAQFDALIAAVREDEKQKCIAAVEHLEVLAAPDDPTMYAIVRVIENA